MRDNTTAKLDVKEELQKWYTSNVEHNQPYMTSFHVELTAGNTDYVTSVLENLPNNELMSCLLNTAIIPCSLYPYRQNSGDRAPSPVNSSSHDDETTSCESDVDASEILNDLHTTTATPLALASFSGDPELVLLLIRYGAEVKTRDAKGNTIVHDLVYLSDKYPDRAVRVYDALVSSLDANELRSLLQAENADGLLPVDVAASLSLPEMLSAILRTDNVYRYVTANCGTHVHVCYDVTRYETEGRCTIHLLYYLSCVTEYELHRVDENRMFQKEPIASWITAKYRQYMRYLYITLTEWLVLLFVYFGNLVYSSNHLTLPPPWLSIAVILTCGLSLTFDLINTYSQASYVTLYWRRVYDRRIPVSVCGVYRLYHVLFCVTAIVSGSLTFSPDVELTSPVYLGFTVCGILSGLISILFFTQLSDRLGHMLTAIEKMVTITVQFTLFILVVFLALSLSFYVLHFRPYLCQNGTHPYRAPSTPSPGDLAVPSMVPPSRRCLDGIGVDPDLVMFSTFARSLHETFLLCLGIMVPRSVYFTQSKASSLAIALYAFCLLSMTIILLNLLLALVNKRINEIDVHKMSILAIQKLSVALFIANNEFLINKVSSMVRRNRVFPTDPNDCRVYIRTIEATSK